MPGPIAYLNGRYLLQSELVLPVLDAGLVFGATITDLCRTFQHRLFRLNDHLARFRRSCDRACVPQVAADKELAQVAEKLVTENAALLAPDQDLALIMIATPGAIAYLAGQTAGDPLPTLAMHTFPLPCYRYRALFEEGARLITPKIQHVPAACIDPGIKQRSRLHWWLAEHQAKQTDPEANALLLNTDGHITETASANFLLVRDGTVYTPPRHTVLGGISLQATVELCKESSIPLEERPLSLKDCRTADEAMLSSTPYCLAGVQRINHTSLPWPGPIFEKLRVAWNRLVGMDVAAQICSGR